MRVLDVEQLLDRLDDRYRLLTGGSPVALPRHQTLRAAVDWSHELCDEREKLVWARLSVLAGSFDLETAEVVCAGEGAPPEGAEGAEGEAPAGSAAPLRSHDILDAVTGLVDKSVLSRESGPDGIRYRLLDTLRHYGLDRLRRLPGEESAARRRLLRRAAACERAWFGPGQREIVARLRADQDNLRSALDFSLSTPGEPLSGLRLAGTLWFYWHACGAPREGRHSPGTPVPWPTTSTTRRRRRTPSTSSASSPCSWTICRPR